MITLISPPSIKTFSGLQMQTPNLPIGLAYVAASVKDAGYAYHVIDGTGEALDRIRPYEERTDFMIQGLTDDEIIARIPPDTDVIGISCMFSSLWPMTRGIVEHVRTRFPDALVVLGGEHGTALPELVLRTSSVDVVVLGEGEETFVNLLRARRDGTSLREVKGIAFRDGEEVVNTGLSARKRDVDSIPLPDWDSFPVEEYISRHQYHGINLGRSMPLIGTRGCPFKCTFCSSPNMWTQRWYPRDPKLVADEIELYMRRFRATNFNFQDLTAIIKRQWIVDFCNELIGRGLKLTWQMPSGTRSEVFDDEVADLLYRSGCRALAFAPESGSPEILKIVKKQVHLDRMLVSMRAAVKRGLKLSCFILIGFPDDTKETINQSLKLIRKMAVLGVYDVAVSKFVPYPGSELFKRLHNEGRFKLDDEFFLWPMDFHTDRVPSFVDGMTNGQLYRKMIWMFTNFYVISFACHPARTARALVKALFTGVEETRYAKWFIDFFFTRPHWRRLAKKAAH
jgi:anaerobic magnesium-protoporphyrin IX monomethyl ester cyclase